MSDVAQRLGTPMVVLLSLVLSCGGLVHDDGDTLEPTGALVCFNSLTTSGGSADGVVRFTFTNPPEVLYDERTNLVKIHISELVTGP